MIRFTVGREEREGVRETNFDDFLDLTKGRSIVSAAASAEFVELGISGRRMLRFSRSGTDVEANVVSTLNTDEVPSLTIRLRDAPRDLTLRGLETRLGGLRRLHALAYLDRAERVGDVRNALTSGATNLDDLLDERDQIFIESASTGSWYATLWCKTLASYKVLLGIVAVLYSRGREAFLRKLEAEADLKQLDVRKAGAEAELKELDADKQRFENTAGKIDYILKLREHLPEAESQMVSRFVVDAVRDALGPRASGEDVAVSLTKLLGTGPLVVPHESPRQDAVPHPAPPPPRKRPETKKRKRKR